MKVKCLIKVIFMKKEWWELRDDWGLVKKMSELVNNYFKLLAVTYQHLARAGDQRIRQTYFTV